MNDTGVIYDLQGNVLFNRSATTPFRYRGNLAGRGNISGFSARAACRMRRYLRTCEAEYRVMGTLTYPCGYPTDGPTVKGHLKELFRRLRRSKRYQQPGFSVFWFLEFQRRGAPHYHFFCTDEISKEWLASQWYDIVRSEDERHLHAGTRIEHLRSGRRGTCSYASKYAAKHSQKDVPSEFKQVGRFWGVIGNRSCQQVTVFIKAEFVGSQDHEELKKALRDAVKSGGRMGYTVINREKRFSQGVYIRRDDVASRVKSVLHRFGLLFEVSGQGWISYPDRELEFDDWVDSR